jgi:hypothetical protein
MVENIEHGLPAALRGLGDQKRLNFRLELLPRALAEAPQGFFKITKLLPLERPLRKAFIKIPEIEF